MFGFFFRADGEKPLRTHFAFGGKNNFAGARFFPVFAFGLQHARFGAAQKLQINFGQQFGVKQAPTLVITTENGFEKYAGAGAIKQYAMAHSA